MIDRHWEGYGVSSKLTVAHQWSPPPALTLNRRTAVKASGYHYYYCGGFSSARCKNDVKRGQRILIYPCTKVTHAFFFNVCLHYSTRSRASWPRTYVIAEYTLFRLFIVPRLCIYIYIQTTHTHTHKQIRLSCRQNSQDKHTAENINVYRTHDSPATPPVSTPYTMTRTAASLPVPTPT